MELTLSKLESFVLFAAFGVFDGYSHPQESMANDIFESVSLGGFYYLVHKYHDKIPLVKHLDERLFKQGDELKLSALYGATGFLIGQGIGKYLF